MDGSAVSRIAELAGVARHQIDGREYATEALHLVAPPLVARVQVMTLTGLSDYLEANPDGLELAGLIVHVASPTVVHLLTAKPNEYRQRELFVTAECKPRVFPFDKYQEVEEFIIALQTYFVKSVVTEEIQALVSNIQDDGSIAYADNGLTQQVTAKTGIVAVGNVKVPNPVELAPYRTFLEVEQPESLFVFRIRKGEKGPPTCALFLADGGSWELAAIQRVRDWLKDELPDGVTILA